MKYFSKQLDNESARMIWILESSDSCRALNAGIIKADIVTKDYDTHIPHGHSRFGTKRRTLDIASGMLKYQVALLE